MFFFHFDSDFDFDFEYIIKIVDFKCLYGKIVFS